MKGLGLFVLCILFTACGHEPLRKLASFDASTIVLGTIDASKSTVKQFPPEKDGHTFRYFFYVQLKDPQNRYVDVDEKDFQISSENKNLPFKVERILSGRYYLIVEQNSELAARELTFFVQGKKLKERFKLFMREAHSDHTKIRILKRLKGKLHLELALKDSKGQPVEVPGSPEIILDGNGLVEDLKHKSHGKWEFTLLHAEQNQIIYISVRVQGSYFKNLFRFHYVER